MHFAPKIVLNCSRGYRTELDAMVEQFIADGVKFVAVAGSDCSLVEDIIDELVVGDGSDESRYILTSSHPGEPVRCRSGRARRGYQPAGLVGVRETGLMWANMLRAFQVGKALTSAEGPSSWMRPSRVTWAQVSWPECHLTKASASAVM
jgi:hypothetical protein